MQWFANIHINIISNPLAYKFIIEKSRNGDLDKWRAFFIVHFKQIRVHSLSLSLSLSHHFQYFKRKCSLSHHF